MFYERYEALCKQAGKSPTALAKEIGISGPSVTKWKQNEDILPDGKNLLRIAEILKCSVDFLLGRTDIIEVCISPIDMLPDDEQTLLTRYRACDDGGKEIIRAYALSVLRDIDGV